MLRHSPDNELPVPDGRYDAATLQKVTALAQRFQERHHESLSAADIEAAGAEVGLDPAFIREALAQIAPPPPTPVQEKRAAVAPGSLDARELEFRSLAGAYGGALAAGLVAALGMMGSINYGWLKFWTLGAPVPLAVLLGFMTGKKGAGFGVGVALIAALSPSLLTLSLPFSSGEPIMPYLLLGAPLAGWLGRQGAGIRDYFFPLPAGEPEAAMAASLAISRPALLSLLFAIQAQLEGQKQHRAFLSVDVVGSTEMKLQASDLAVEYSFTRFRSWVKEIVNEAGGESCMAAGDGTMCAFVDNAAAVRAARRLQEGLAEFNAHHNRLSTPFRIRCGINAGEVASEGAAALGDLHSPVIDLAAALQKRAVPGDIVVSERVAPAAVVELGTLTALPGAVAGSQAFSWRGGPAALALRAAGEMEG